MKSLSTRHLPGVLLLLATLTASGCGFGTRYVFSSSREIAGNPEGRGLAYEEAWFETEDGKRLNGWFLPGSAGNPLVLFFHGNAANISHRVENLDHLHGMGFPVFIFDYRGFGLSEGWPTSEADLRRDARGALAWLAQRGWKPWQMIYFGGSMGAAVAVDLALEACPAGIVLESPFTNLAEIARQTTPITYYLFGWWSIESGFDNLNRIGRLQAPLLIFHGDRDAIVPLEMSQRLFARAREPKALVVIPGAGHSDVYLVGGDAYRQRWLDFANALPAGLAAAPGRP